MLRSFLQRPKKHKITIERIGYARWTQTREIKGEKTVGNIMQLLGLGQEWLSDKYVLLNGKEVPMSAEVQNRDTISIVD